MSFLKELEHLQKTERLFAARAERFEEERADRTREREECRARIAALEGERRTLETQLEAALTALYRTGAPNPTARLVAGESVAKAMRAARYIAYLSQEEMTEMERLGAFRREIEDRARALEEILARLATLEREMESDRRAAARARAETETHLNRLGNDRELHRHALEELSRAHETLSRFFSEVPPGVVASVLNIEAFRGLLPPPVNAKVSIPFGPVAHSRFHTRVPHHGLTFLVPVGTPVRAVFDGTVVMSGWLEGYGQTLILDHGGGYFTVYAHHSALEKRVGENVAKGERVARSGETESFHGPALYFELRHHGRPLDPAPWLRAP